MMPDPSLFWKYDAEKRIGWNIEALMYCFHFFIFFSLNMLKDITGRMRKEEITRES